MNLEKRISYWKDGALDALALAKYNMDGAQYDFGLFLTLLALEKDLKAHVCRVTQSVPPFIHNLIKLAHYSQLHFEQKTWNYCRS